MHRLTLSTISVSTAMAVLQYRIMQQQNYAQSHCFYQFYTHQPRFPPRGAQMLLGNLLLLRTLSSLCHPQALRHELLSAAVSPEQAQAQSETCLFQR